SAKTQERTFQRISGKVWPHAAFGRGRNSLGRQAAPCRHGRPWRAAGNGRSPGRGETARYRGHCGAYNGGLWAARGREEGPRARHPALHVLTRGFVLFDAERNSTFIHFRSATEAPPTHVLLEHGAHEVGRPTVA